jgi:hypothetical protein
LVTFVHNFDEHCQIEGTDNIIPEVEKLQLKDGKEGKEKEEDSESVNLSDCDQTAGIHTNIIEGKVIRKQRKTIVKNVEVEEDKLR